MSVLSLLNGLQHILVETEREGASQDGQSRIGNDGYDRDNRQRKEDGEHSTKNNAAFTRVAPVHQIHNYQKNMNAFD